MKKFIIHLENRDVEIAANSAEQSPMGDELWIKDSEDKIIAVFKIYCGYSKSDVVIRTILKPTVFVSDINEGLDKYARVVGDTIEI